MQHDKYKKQICTISMEYLYSKGVSHNNIFLSTFEVVLAHVKQTWTIRDH